MISLFPKASAAVNVTAVLNLNCSYPRIDSTAIMWNEILNIYNCFYILLRYLSVRVQTDPTLISIHENV